MVRPTSAQDHDWLADFCRPAGDTFRPTGAQDQPGKIRLAALQALQLPSALSPGRQGGSFAAPPVQAHSLSPRLREEIPIVQAKPTSTSLPSQVAPTNTKSDQSWIPTSTSLPSQVAPTTIKSDQSWIGVQSIRSAPTRQAHERAQWPPVQRQPADVTASLASLPVTRDLTWEYPSQSFAEATTPQPQSFELPAAVDQLNEMVKAPKRDGGVANLASEADILDCNGPTMEEIVRELQESVELLMRENASQAEYRDSVEGQFAQQGEFLKKVSSDQAAQQEQLLTQIDLRISSTWRGSVESQLSQQAQLLSFTQSRLNQQDEALANINSWRSSKDCNPDLADVQPRLAKLEKHLPEMMVEQDIMKVVEDIMTRQSRLETYLQTLREDVTTFETRMAQQENAMQNTQEYLEKMMEVPFDDFRLGLLGVEERVNQLQSDTAMSQQMCQEALASDEARVKKLEDAADSNMNITHWETIHALCDNVQVQQQQQMDSIRNLEADRESVGSVLKQQMDLIYNLQSDKQAAAARVSHLEEIGLQGQMNASHWDSVHELCGNVQSQQEEHANLIHGLQSEIQGLLREYLIGTLASPEKPSKTSTPPPEPTERPAAASPSPTQKPPLAEVNGDLPDPALELELSKFTKFAVVEAVQKDLVRLPQLR